MGLQPPSWIDSDFMEKCIQNGDEDRNITVKSFDTSLVIPPGNNYISILWRLNVKYLQKSCEEIQSVSLIVKTPRETDSESRIYEQFTQIEFRFYNNLLPLLKCSMFAPKNFLCTVPSVVVMEDLTANGYLMADRLKGLDYDHCRLYVLASTSLHAATAAAHKSHPELVESLGVEKIFLNESECFKGSIRLGSVAVQCMADQMETIDEFKKYAGLVRAASGTIWEDLVEIYKKDQTLNVLGEGDPSITNMMFKYDQSGNVVDIKLLDFQGLRYSSPVADFIFFLWTSANHEVRQHRLDDLYHVYCESLNAKLDEFNCSERLSYEELLITIRRYYPAILYTVAFFTALMGIEEPVDIVAATTLAGDVDVPYSTLHRLFPPHTDKTYSECKLPEYLKYLESIGLFQFLEGRRGY